MRIFLISFFLPILVGCVTSGEIIKPHNCDGAKYIVSDINVSKKHENPPGLDTFLKAVKSDVGSQINRLGYTGDKANRKVEITLTDFHIKGCEK